MPCQIFSLFTRCGILIITPAKRAQKVYFFKKANNVNYFSVTFNNKKVVICSCKMHLKLVLELELNFNNHIEVK